MIRRSIRGSNPSGAGSADFEDESPIGGQVQVTPWFSQGPSADPSRGRAVFNRTCFSCHKLFDSGGDVGPELTGSDRANADYILENVLDPSAIVSRDFTLTSIATADGRLISGIIREQTDASLVIQTANERVVVPREDVEAIKSSHTSMMPEGLLDPLSPGEIRDLFAYLASSKQVSARRLERVRSHQRNFRANCTCTLSPTPGNWGSERWP